MFDWAIIRFSIVSLNTVKCLAWFPCEFAWYGRACFLPKRTSFRRTCIGMAWSQGGHWGASPGVSSWGSPWDKCGTGMDEGVQACAWPSYGTATVIVEKVQKHIGTDISTCCQLYLRVNGFWCPSIRIGRIGTWPFSRHTRASAIRSCAWTSFRIGRRTRCLYRGDFLCVVEEPSSEPSHHTRHWKIQSLRDTMSL